MRYDDEHLATLLRTLPAPPEEVMDAAKDLPAYLEVLPPLSDDASLDDDPSGSAGDPGFGDLGGLTDIDAPDPWDDPSDGGEWDS